MTVDFVVFINGTVTMELDSGEAFVLNQGDFVVQQATMHSWSNESDQWARILRIMLQLEAPVVNGRGLETVWPYEHCRMYLIEKTQGDLPVIEYLEMRRPRCLSIVDLDSVQCIKNRGR